MSCIISHCGRIGPIILLLIRFGFCGFHVVVRAGGDRDGSAEGEGGGGEQRAGEGCGGEQQAGADVGGERELVVQVRKLRYLGFVQEAVAHALVYLTGLYGVTKDHAGLLRPGVDITESK